MQIVWLILVFFYLVIQAVEDMRTGTVYVMLNNMVLVALTIDYCLIFPREGSNVLTVMIALGIYTVYRLGFYASGDMKAMLIILLASRYLPTLPDGVSLVLTYGQPQITAFLAGLFFSNLAFLIISHIQGAKRGDRLPFFPYLLFGYTVMLLLQGWRF